MRSSLISVSSKLSHIYIHIFSSFFSFFFLFFVCFLQKSKGCRDSKRRSEKDRREREQERGEGQEDASEPKELTDSLNQVRRLQIQIEVEEVTYITILSCIGFAVIVFYLFIFLTHYQIIFCIKNLSPIFHKQH